MNLETKNSDYAPEERTLFFGPNLQFRFGPGFLNVGLQLRKEWNHNGNLGKNESYDVDFNIEPVWHFPFRIGAARLRSTALPTTTRRRARTPPAATLAPSSSRGRC